MKSEHPTISTLSPQKFTSLVEKFIMDRSYEAALALVAEYENLHSENATYDRVRVERARNWISDSQQLENEFRHAAEAPGLELIELKPFCDQPKAEIDESAPLPNLDEGRYSFSSSSSSSGARTASEQNTLFILSNDSLARDKGFFRETKDIHKDFFNIFLNAGICVQHPRAGVCFDQDGQFDPSISGSFARRTTINVARMLRSEIESAVILPFPYGAKNFYHVMSEMIYGLRYANLTSSNVPIVYHEDYFSLLPFFCKALEINQSRLLTTKEVSDVVFSKSLLPSAPPFYWNSSVIEFFEKIRDSAETWSNDRANHFKKIYLSRSRAGRRPPLEEALEDLLKSKGFQIVHAESLTIEQQVHVFS